MNVAILSESSADESSLRIIVDALLGVKTNPVATMLRSRGWSSVRSTFSAVAKSLHYYSEAEALVVVVDSNHTFLTKDKPKNRLYEFQKLAQQCRDTLNPVPGRVPLKIAVGVAAPAIEAWWLCKSKPHISEAAWEKGLVEQCDPYSKLDLKKWLYGSEFQSLELMTQKMTEAAREIARDLQLLENAFPNGFGSLAQELRNWRRIN
jgi:hypothetical protein